MRHLMITAMLLLGLLVGACGGTEDPAPEQAPTPELGKADALECTYKCVKCLPPKAPACDYHCFYVGKCESRCDGFEQCGIGYVWSEIACRCLPDVP